MKHIYLTTFLFLLCVGRAQTIGIELLASGFNDPVEITHAGDTRLFVVEQRGLVKIVNPDGTINATPFINLSSIVNQTANEGGLLGLAFHPEYASNGFFFVNYTNASDDTRIARYSVSDNPNVANTVATPILSIDQPSSNHNGGTLRFGPDGYLYIGMGDGGGGGDPNNHGQNKNSLLGKMLRIDVNSATPYSIPDENPFVDVAGADEIWALGLRNPWKFSFDSETGDLWIADVGQENVEEINKSSAIGGLNYGWRCYEGNNVYNNSGCAPQSTMTFPFAVYSSASGSGNCSITGGHVYRGLIYPNFVGKYFFADYCSNKIGMLTDNATMTFSTAFSGSLFTTFGLDASGELYIAASGNGSAGSGKVYKVKDTSLSVGEQPVSDFSLSPNPARGYIQIHSKTADFPLSARFFDVNGRKVLESVIASEDDRINTSSLVPGIYIVNISDQAGAMASRKMLVE